MLPTEKQQPAPDGLLYRRILLSGAQKLGKTTAAIDFTERPLIIDTEGSAEGYECYRVACPSWTVFRQLGGELAKGSHSYTCLVVDTVDELARLCQEHVIAHLAGRENDLDKGEYHHPSDFAFGKGWNAVSEEFRVRVAKLCSLGVPVLFISHEKDQQVESRAGTRTVFSPDVGTAGVRKWLLGFVDLILRAAVVQTTEGDRHVVIAQPSTDNLVGGRTPPGAAPLPPMFSLTGDALLRALSARQEPAQPPAPAAKRKREKDVPAGTHKGEPGVSPEPAPAQAELGAAA